MLNLHLLRRPWLPPDLCHSSVKPTVTSLGAGRGRGCMRGAQLRVGAHPEKSKALGLNRALHWSHREEAGKVGSGQGGAATATF